MKTITFKTLSILLAAVLLVAALPVTAFADDVSPSAIRPCEHNYEVRTNISIDYISNELHRVREYYVVTCLWCGDSYISNDVVDRYEYHEFDDSVDPECDMQGVCIYCNEMIYW